MYSLERKDCKRGRWGKLGWLRMEPARPEFQIGKILDYRRDWKGVTKEHFGHFLFVLTASHPQHPGFVPQG